MLNFCRASNALEYRAMASARSSGWMPLVHPTPLSSSRLRPENSSQRWLNQLQSLSGPARQIIIGASSANS